jgi:Heme/copper-type cytochrome/quinol oxidases, subunit 2
MLDTGLGAILLFSYLTAPFLVIFIVLVLLSLRRGRSREGVAQMSLTRAAEVAWLIGVGIVWLTINLFSIPWIPWLQAGAQQTAVDGEAQVVQVDAYMWGYKITPMEVRKGPVKFVARALDTIHSLAIYTPDGRLLTTIMLMPGMREEVTIVFDREGEYVVRCLEYCGDGHGYMYSKISVVG